MNDCPVRLGHIKESKFNMTLSFYDPFGVAPTQWANQGKDPIKILVPETLLVRDGKSYSSAEEGDGIKLIFPTGTESCGRVKSGVAPTLMGGAVVGVVVRK